MTPQTTGKKVTAGRDAPGRPPDERRIISNRVQNTPAFPNDDDAEPDQQQAHAKKATNLGDTCLTHKVEDLCTTVATGALVRLGTQLSPYAARAPPPTMPATGLRLLSYRDLALRGIPYSRSHLRRLEASGKFPRHLTLGEGLGALIAWPEHEVSDWIAERMARRVPLAKPPPLAPRSRREPAGTSRGLLWENMVVGGTTDGHARAAEISRGRLRAILESARGIKPDDTSADAREKRKASIADFDGLTFIGKIGVEKGESRGNGENYPDRNCLDAVITPDKKDWHQVEQAPRPQAPSSGEAAVVPIKKPAWAS
jgi:predicted DNA-binding transcriptional regulator AlpA